MTNVQLSLTNLLLPAGPAGGQEHTPTKGRPGEADQPARSPERSGPPVGAARGDRLKQASTAREEARSAGHRETGRGPVRRDAGGRRADRKSHPRAAKGTNAKPARRRPTKPHLNPTVSVNVLAHLAQSDQGQEGRISFEAIVEGLVNEIAQAAAHGTTKPHARLVKQDAAATIKVAGASLSDSLTGLKAAVVRQVVPPKASYAKADSPTGTSSAATAQAAAKVTAAAAVQAAEPTEEAAKPEHPAASTARTPTGPSSQPIPSPPTGTGQQKADQPTSPATAAGAAPATREVAKAASVVPAAADLPTEEASAAGKDVVSSEAPAHSASQSGVRAHPASENVAPRPRATAPDPAGEEPKAIPQPSASAGAAPITPVAAAPSGEAGSVVGRQAEAFQALQGEGLEVQSAELIRPEQATTIRAGVEALYGPDEMRNQTPAADQIVETVRLRGVRTGEQIIVRLDPPQLGRVRLTLHADGQELRGLLEVDNPRTLTELQREAPALADRLAEGGVELRRLDVQLSDQGRSDSTNSAPQQGAGGGEGPPQRDAAERGNGDQPGPAVLGAGDLEPEELPDQQIADQSINIWM